MLVGLPYFLLTGVWVTMGSGGSVLRLSSRSEVGEACQQLPDGDEGGIQQWNLSVHREKHSVSLSNWWQTAVQYLLTFCKSFFLNLFIFFTALENVLCFKSTCQFLIPRLPTTAWFWTALVSPKQAQTRPFIKTFRCESSQRFVLMIHSNKKKKTNTNTATMMSDLLR